MIGPKITSGNAGNFNTENRSAEQRLYPIT